MNSVKKDFKVGDIWIDGRGREVTIIKTDLRGQFTIVGTVASVVVAADDVRTYTPDGAYTACGLTSNQDLVKKYEPPVGPEEVFVFVRKQDNLIDRYGIALIDPGQPLNKEGWRVVKYRRVDEE